MTHDAKISLQIFINDHPFPPLLGINITHYIVTYALTIIYAVPVRTIFDGL
jgi:hypothetical protein